MAYNIRKFSEDEIRDYDITFHEHLKSNQNTVFIDDDKTKMLNNYFNTAMPYRVKRSKAWLYYEFSKQLYENPENERLYFSLNIEAVCCQQKLCLEKVSAIQGHFFDSLNFKLFSICQNQDVIDEFYESCYFTRFNFIIYFCPYETMIEGTIFLYDYMYGTIRNENEERALVNEEIEIEESKDEEEIEARYTRLHQETLGTVEVTNQYPAFEFTGLCFDKFWEINKNNFYNGSFKITYGWLGIEKIERVTEENNEASTNQFKSFKSSECVICLSNQPVIMFCNCGHICMCEACFKNYKSSKCPVCKTANVNIRPIC